LLLEEFANDIGFDRFANTVGDELAWSIPFLERKVCVVGFASYGDEGACDLDISSRIGELRDSVESIEAEGAVYGDHLVEEFNSW